MGLEKILDKLFSHKYLSEERREESDYDLVYIISKLRERRKKRDNEKRKQEDKDSEVDALLEILNENSEKYSESEINYLFNEICELNEK